MKPKSLIPSPCIAVCTMEENTGYCRGCLRTLKEIAGWERYSDTEKKQVLALLDARRAEARDSGGTAHPHC